MMEVQRLRYMLPNLFTLANIFAGVYSIKLAMGAQSAEQMTVAAWMIVVAMVCDMFDGRVARMTNAETEFGTQMDSLTDSISFGVAPAFLMYSWGLKSLGTAGIFFVFIYTGGAIMRLARFNVKAKESGGASKYFLGLPTPLAAGTVISVVMAHTSITGRSTTGATWNVALMAVLLGGLMVSSIRYRTFKDVNFRGRAIAVLAVLAGLVSVIAIVAEPSVAFVVCMVVYVVVGVCGGLVELSRSFFGDDEFSEVESGVSADENYSEDNYAVEAPDEER